MAYLIVYKWVYQLIRPNKVYYEFVFKLIGNYNINIFGYEGVNY